MSTALAVNPRIKTAFLFIILIFGIISMRLFYWQVMKAQASQTAVEKQTTGQNMVRGKRGKIYTADNRLLVGNKTVYDLYINKNELKLDQLEVINQLTNIFETYYQTQTTPAQPNSDNTQATTAQFDPSIFKQALVETLSKDSNWTLLVPHLNEELKLKIETTKIAGLHLLEQAARHYPEGSMAAHITGFVGKDENENDIGYFGIEGALNKELQGQEKLLKYKKDGQGQQLADQKLDFSNLDGRDVILTIRRDIQFIASEALAKGVEYTQSTNGELVIMDPKTGAILALATWPHYDPENYQQTATQTYKNPVLTDLYEPGSTFKIFTMAAALDLGLITPDTTCDTCNGPRIFGDYTIKTWNEQYHPNISMIEALKQSDNTALVFVAEKIGAEKFIEYQQNFGFSQALEIDLQEDSTTPLKTSLRPVELANASFGQGFLTNSLQMIRAAGAIANQGEMMKPYIIQQVSDAQTQNTIVYHPQVLKRVISADAAHELTKMMIYSAPDKGNWINQHYLVAGKTGTAQIATVGGYQESGTMASFIGFAPADDPKFVMIVKLREPSISPWAESTAVPIWYEVADKIMLLL